MSADLSAHADVANDGRGELAVSLALGLVVTAFSIVGLAATRLVYANDQIAAAFRPNDATTLIIAVPALAASLALRRHTCARLLRAGALLTFTYNSLVALMSLPFGWPAILHLAITIVSVGVALHLLAGTDSAALRLRLGGHVAETWSGGALTLFGLIFAVRAAWILYGDAGGPAAARADVALLVADAVFGALWAASGWALAMRRPLGYSVGAASLLQAALLFMALVVLLLLKPFLDGSALMVGDLVVTVAMTAIFAVPVALFVRGIFRTERRAMAPPAAV